jgi:hypothetical protein
VEGRRNLEAKAEKHADVARASVLDDWGGLGLGLGSGLGSALGRRRASPRG